jgi:GNAT superfamily N-acetyltransferase
LLRLADDSEKEIRGYYQRGVLYGYLDGGRPVGMVLAIPVETIPMEAGEVEFKAVAVDESLHGRGVGSRMLAEVLGELRKGGTRRVLVGTASAGTREMQFYQRAGFRLWRIERDFFTPERGYPVGLEANGIPIRDMVWMDQDLQASG